MKSLTISRRESGPSPLLDVCGRLTLGEGSRALRQALDDVAAEGHKYVLLDLNEVSYMDSSGLGALLAGYKSVKAVKGSVVLLRVPPRVHDLLRVSRLTEIFLMFPTEDEAALYLAGAA